MQPDCEQSGLGEMKKPPEAAVDAICQSGYFVFARFRAATRLASTPFATLIALAWSSPERCSTALAIRAQYSLSSMERAFLVW